MKWNLRYEFEDLGTLHCVWRRKHKKTSSKIWLRSSECGRPSGLSTCWKVRNNYRPHLYIPIESSHQVSMVILLDPRSLLLMDVNVEKAFEDSGKLLGCAFSLAGTGDGVALFRGEIPLRHYVMLEKILLGSFHVSQSIFWIILILEDPCMSLQSPCQKALTPVALEISSLKTPELQVSQRAWRYFVRHYLAMKRKSTRIQLSCYAHVWEMSIPMFVTCVNEDEGAIWLEPTAQIRSCFKMRFRKLGVLLDHSSM